MTNVSCRPQLITIFSVVVLIIRRKTLVKAILRLIVFDTRPYVLRTLLNHGR